MKQSSKNKSESQVLKNKSFEAPEFETQQLFLNSPIGREFSGGRDVLPSGKYGTKWATKKEGIVENCPLGVPKAYQRHDFNPPRAKGPPRKMWRKYAGLWLEAYSGNITDETLYNTFQSRMKERPILFSQGDDNEGFFFQGMVKGCPDYNRRLVNIIKDRSEFLVKERTHFYFLTITYAVNTYGAAIPVAWQKFNKHLFKMMHAIKRKYGAMYCVVLEATERGYPHAHIVFGIDSLPDKKHPLLKAGQEIKYGKLRDFIKKRVASPEFKLQWAKPYGLVGYLSKYISKGLDALVVDKKVDKITLSPDDRKALLSCMCPVISKVRQFRSSIRMSRAKNEPSQILIEQQLETVRAQSELGIWSEGGVSALIALLNNLTLKCRAHVWALFELEAKRHWKDALGYVSNVDTEEIRDFKRAAYPLGCSGCVVSDAVDHYLKRKTEFTPMTPRVSKRTLPIVHRSGSTLAGIYSFFALQSDENLENIDEAGKKLLTDTGVLCNNQEVRVAESYLSRRI